MIRTLVFAAAILALAEVNVAGKRIGAHVTAGVGTLWKLGGGWVTKGFEAGRDWGRKQFAKLDPPRSPASPKRASAERSVREDVSARDRARLQSLLESESP